MEGNLFNWSITTQKLNISAKFGFHPLNNVLFPIEMTIESFRNSISADLGSDDGNQQDLELGRNPIRLRYSAIQFQPANKVQLLQHLRTRDNVNIFELQPPQGKMIKEVIFSTSVLLLQYLIIIIRLFSAIKKH